MLFASLIALFSSLFTMASLLGGTYFAYKAGYLNSFLEPQEAIITTEESEPTVFLPLSKVVMTVRGLNQDHLVLIEISIETHVPDNIGDVETFMPLVKNKLLRLFSNKTHSDLVGFNSLEMVETEIELTLIDVLQERGITDAIEDVIVTKFIVQ